MDLLAGLNKIKEAKKEQEEVELDPAVKEAKAL